MAEKISRSKSSPLKKNISRVNWLPSDWQREFDRWIEEISLLLISHNQKTFSDSEFAILDPIQDEAKHAKRENNMLAHRAALRRYVETARSLLAARAEGRDTASRGGTPGEPAATEAASNPLDQI